MITEPLDPDTMAMKPRSRITVRICRLCDEQADSCRCPEPELLHCIFDRVIGSLALVIVNDRMN